MSIPHLASRYVSKLARDRAALGVLVIAAAGRVLWLALVDNGQWGDVQTYDSAARHLALHGELRYDGYPVVYRAWFPPAWPFFLSLFYRAFGTEHELFKLVNLALSLLVVALTMRIGARVFGRRVGLAGGLCMALLPGQIFYVNLAQYEIFLTALVMLMLCGLLETDWSQLDGRRAPAHGLGVLLAVAVLARPPLVLLPLALLFYWRSVAGKRRAWTLAGIAGGYVLAASLAWGARNFAVLGEPVLFSTNGGYNLWHGNNPNATGSDFVPPQSADPRLNPLLLMGDERVMNRRCTRYALDYIREHPARFFAMMPRRVFGVFDTDTTGLYLSFLRPPLHQPTVLEPLRRNSRLLESLTFRSYAVVMALALIGLLRASWRAAPVRLLGIFILYWLAGAAVTFGQDRYRVPIMPIFCLFAGCGAQQLQQLQQLRRLARGGTSSGTGATSPGLKCTASTSCHNGRYLWSREWRRRVVDNGNLQRAANFAARCKQGA